MYCQHCSIPRSKGGGTAHKHIALSFTRALFRYASMEQIHKKPHPTYLFSLKVQRRSGWSLYPSRSSLRRHKTAWKWYRCAIPCLFLAPQARWPRQLQQAVIVLRYAIETLGKRPSDIVLQGDSAGAHLALALLSHLAHPHPQGIVVRFSVDEPLRGAMLLFPWVDFGINHASSSGNADRDIVSAQTLNSWARIFLGQTVEDYPSGLVGRDLPVSRIFVGAGEDEVLLDPIQEMAEKMKVELPDVSISIVPREFHVEPITDFALKLPPGLQFKAMTLWLNQTFSE
ncbi:hypothetical protein HAV15_012477 [Penicillium sp. str. |nr:hypothetical protein HAV15_012477 [Penicillium sp. str. \